MKTGIELIAEERQRQIEVEGWTPEHDAEHDFGELAGAAACYALSTVFEKDGIGIKRVIGDFWPSSWDTSWWKPKDKITDLKRAGALIAAEIDRLQFETKGE